MRILKTSAALGCALLLSVISGGVANAATVENFDSGWYTNGGFTAGVPNINVGSSSLSGAIYNHYLAFNLAGLTDQNITSATLTYYGGNGNNTSSNSETLGLFDYVGSIDALLNNGAFDPTNVAIYTDLGNGASYGSAVVAPGPIAQFSVTLSAAAIANLNAAAHNAGDSRFVVGGALQSISAPFADEWLFAIFGPGQARVPAARLDLQTAPVPEPATWAMMILGFGAVGAACRRKRSGPKVSFA